ncbi:hypothetical protein TRFO_02378 [Tritrichomonas foetus]|uniref:Uncharacterized protein n=1 Tax=Tritrichomonas foetus TaxID=1144522 RepID=A0A1J4J846_9EUKA|nr:hypothetical protein TRFO_02378 [Tritrichomonas foetus]|eukprot:OHS93851.1 hypothetical protein TRFO_02378 [Tritrichomonas foetus]
MRYIYLKVLQIQDVKKAFYSIWAGTTPLGFNKRGECKYKKGTATCKHMWQMTTKDPNKTSIEIILKSKKWFHGETEVGRLHCPLTWFPTNAIVTDWFPLVDSMHDKKFMVELSIHVSEQPAKPFHAHTGALLVIPAWDRPGTPAIERITTMPIISAPTVNIIEEPGQIPPQFMQQQVPQPVPQGVARYSAPASMPQSPNLAPNGQQLPPLQNIPQPPSAPNQSNISDFQPPQSYDGYQQQQTSFNQTYKSPPQQSDMYVNSPYSSPYADPSTPQKLHQNQFYEPTDPYNIENNACGFADFPSVCPTK